MGGKGRGKRKDTWDDHTSGETPSNEAIARAAENPAFTAYYREQLAPLIPSDSEWERFEKCLRSPLPVTFRFSGCAHSAVAHARRDEMESTLLPSVRASLQEQADGANRQPPQPLAWYPSRLAWQFDLSRAQLRGKVWHGDDGGDGRTGERSAPIKAFHSWLLREAELGHVQRQEAVSMVPPLLLDVRRGQTVLDMCASPGSKTQQLLEMLEETDGSTAASGASRGCGLVVANDADEKRCHLLTSRAAKLFSSALVVTNHDARLFPESFPADGGPQPVQFDRVLCDVPCSGDGTLRKAPAIWRRWTPGPANMLHKLQLQIATKGARLLKVGGRLVYSTCSLNPIENEAVVASLLRAFSNRCLRLLDVSTALPHLQRRAGLLHWRVWHRGQWHNTWESVRQRFPRKCPRLEELFPPSAAEAKEMGLERCVRLLPHDQDTGGFFVAVFEKVAEHVADDGALPEGEAEVVVAEGSSVLPEALAMKSEYLPAEGEGGEAVVEEGEGGEEVEVELRRAIERRSAARHAKNFVLADRLRDELTAKGVSLDDSRNRWELTVDGVRLAGSIHPFDQHRELTSTDSPPAGGEAAEEERGPPSSPPAESKRRRPRGAAEQAHDEAERAAVLELCQSHAAVLHSHGGKDLRLVAETHKAARYPPLFVPSASLAAAVQAFFGLSDDFPFSRLVARCPTARSLVLLSEESLALLRNDAEGKLRVVNAGVRLFDTDCAKGVGCAHRACHDGLAYLLPHATRQRAPCSARSLAAVLRDGVLPAAAAAAEECLGAALAACAAGSVVLECAAPRLALAAFLAPSGLLRPMVGKAERQALLLELEGAGEKAVA
ncbi:hypothetical protein AB1Y20_014854 [Prymnesium parvum]|uniref:SAM-dependent MTase RsmB/NOP-type domain-containing protein n=1 Tax=Prymnesium parvum TaxID=97485 RepID=A0AB34JZP9_PRYPA